MGSALRLISWNTGRRAGVRRQAEALLGRKPDLIALQEVTPSASVSFEEHLGGGGLVHVAYRNPPATRRTRSHGVLVASRFPLRPLSPLDVPWPEKALSLLVRTDDLQLELHAVHVPPGSSNGWIKIETLEGIYKGLAKKPRRPRILCGDFNTPQRELPSGEIVTWGQTLSGDGARPRTKVRGGWGKRWDAGERAVIEGLAAYDLADVFRSLHGLEAEGFSWVLKRKGRKIKRRFDHVFACRSLRPRHCEYVHAWREQKLSDHSAVEVVFDPA